MRNPMFFGWVLLWPLTECLPAASFQDGLPVRGPHHRVVSTGAGSYVTVANGLHYFEGGEWKESDPTIDVQPHGATALRLPHKLLFGQSLAAGVDILTPDGLHLRGAPRAIAYFDALDGRTVILGTLKDAATTPAQLHPGSVLVYPDAFQGVRANVRYIVARGSLIQCVVFPENLPDPAVFGLNRDTVRIEIWNAFTEAPPPEEIETTVWVEPNPTTRMLMADPDLIDATLVFGEMRMIPGKGFMLSSLNGNPAPGMDAPGSIPVFKRWVEGEQAAWLIEAIEYKAAQESLARLPGSSLVINPNTAGEYVSEEREFPPVAIAQPVNLPIEIVSSPSAEDGFGLDYTLVYSTASWTFQSGVTYLVDGNFTISSSTTIQTNAIIKYRRNAWLTVSGTIATPSTGPPAILTSFDDYTAGELIPGGTPVGYIGSVALNLYNLYSPYPPYISYVQNLDIRHFTTAISDYSPFGSQVIRDCRFHVCQRGLNAYYSTVTLSNIVACAVPTPYANAGSSSITTTNISTDCQRTAVAWGDNQFGQCDLPTNLTNVIAVAAGEKHSLVLKADGTVSVIGTNNQYGQLNVPTGLSNVIAIAAGPYHNLALKFDGTVVAWGDNGAGQTNVPSGLTNVVTVAAGYGHSLALRFDGSVVAWGISGFGITNVPANVTNAVAVAAGAYHSVALLSNGTVVAWGENTYGQIDVPVNLTNAVALGSGSFHNSALKTDGVPIGWGVGYFGQTNVPAGLTNVITLTCGAGHTVALRRDGTVTSWGYFLATNAPTGISGVLAIAAGGDHSLAIRSSLYPVIITQPTAIQRKFVGGSVTFSVAVSSTSTVTYQWRFNGTNITGATNASLTLTNLQVADAGNYTVVVSNSSAGVTSTATVLTVVAEPIILSQPSDMRVLAGPNITFSITLSNAVGVTNFWKMNGATVAIGPSSNYAITASAATHGTWSVISSNGAGATLSDPWSLQVVLPGQVVGWGDTRFDQTNAPYPLTNLVAVAAGDTHSLGLKEDGTVIGWGMGAYGETNPPVGLSDVIAIGAAGAHSLALKGDGTVTAWGNNKYGQTNVPSGLSGVKAIAAGYWHNLALKTNGTVVAWGYNGNNQTNVPAGLNATAVSAGWQHSLALRTDGTVCTWGLNNGGQCDVPSGLSNVVAISAGIWHSLALRSDGTVVGWGESTYGEASPPSGLSNVMAIAAGGQFSMALKNDGTVLAWGKPVPGVTNVPAPLGDVYAISAGFHHALALTYSPVLNYVIDPTRDLLLVCNTNCSDSVAVMNYYRTNRPMVANANVLGIAGATNAIERYSNLFETTNTLAAPVLNWLTNNPTKRPNFLILFYGVPASTCFSSNACVYAYTGHPSSSYVLWSSYPGRKPFITHINMRTPEDCFRYVDKITSVGGIYSSGKIYISPSNANYGNTNYYFDDVNDGVPGFHPGLCASNGVIAFGGDAAQIVYVPECMNCYSNHLLNYTNVAGFMYWGGHGGMGTGSPTNGQIRFYGSSWHIMQTIESYNGHWVPGGGQTTFRDYFASSAFGGTNYSFAAVGCISNTDEPGLSGGCPPGGVGNSYLYFGLWHARRNFAVCAWFARYSDRFQAVGDPFLIR